MSGGDFGQTDGAASIKIQRELLSMAEQILIELSTIRIHLETITGNVIKKEESANED